MDRRDRAVLDPECLVNDLDHRGEAIGRAGRGSDEILIRIKVAVHAVDDIQRILFFHRGRDDHLLNARRVIVRQFRVGLERTRAVDDQVDAVERQVFDRPACGQGNLGPVDGDRCVAVRDVGIPAPVDRIELEQMGVNLRCADRIVQQGDLGLHPVVDQLTKYELSDAAKAVDGDACHVNLRWSVAGYRPDVTVS